MPKKGYADVVQEPTDEKVKAMNERMARMREALVKKREAEKRGDTPDPTKQMSQEERIGRTGRKMEESDRSRIAQEIRNDEEALAAATDPGQKLQSQAVDTAAIRQRLDRNKMILGHDEDLTARDSEKDRLHSRLKEITDILQKNIPSKREMWPKTGSVEAQQAVRHNVRFQEQYGALCHEYQELKKRLEPEDPYAHSLELIRPD